MGDSPGVVELVRDRVEVLYRDDGDRLWRAVVGFAGDRAVADDAVAEAFAQLLRRGDEVRDPAAWVWRAAFKIAAGDLQRRGRLDPVAVERGVTTEPSVRVQLSRARRALRKELSR